MKTKGYVFAVVAAVCYGLNPLFALPLYDEGMQPLSVLFYRFSIATVVLFVMIAFGKESFKVSIKELLLSMFMGLMFAGSSITLFKSFTVMDAGIASTLLFTYPLIVVILSRIFFKEKVGKITIVSIFVAFAGVLFLYKGEDGAAISSLGLFLIFTSAMSYAIYLIGVNRSVLSKMSSVKLTFYASATELVLLFLLLRCGSDLQMLPSVGALINVSGLGVFTTVVSLVLVTKGIHLIGSTPASIIGALEPITALLVSVFVIGSELTMLNVVGVLLILFSVILVILYN